MNVFPYTGGDSCGKAAATNVGTCGGRTGKIGEGASRLSIDSTASPVDRLRRLCRRDQFAKFIGFMSNVSST